MAIFLAAGLSACSGASNPTPSASPSPLTEETLCGVVSSQILRDDLGFQAESYSHRVDAPSESNSTGYFKCLMRSATDLRLIGINYGSIKTEDDKRLATDGTAVPTPPGNREGVLRVRDNFDGGSTLIWIYPDNRMITIWLQYGDGTGPGGGAEREDLTTLLDSLIEAIPAYVQTIDRSLHTRVPARSTDG
ncbi:hypothetical protein [Actinomyces slackii]|nr:hypothetical protein [Actinomyces slackii]